MPEPSILDARLAEIDRRLRMIQSGLEPVREASADPVAEPPPPISDPLQSPPLPPPSLVARRLATPPPQPADARDEEIAVLTARLSELTSTHERLLATTQNLLIERADVLARATPAVSVAAGPFTDTRALQEFQRAVSGLPQVREVAVREFVGSEGVILDVQL
ncbi:MAG TPA: hypothetical protein VHW04_11310, partial [Solirubrobacteraceae bacterium]|nr:hypothetical protein [Solirubrobacteraceae bacterium]